MAKDLTLDNPLTDSALDRIEQSDPIEAQWQLARRVAKLEQPAAGLAPGGAYLGASAADPAGGAVDGDIYFNTLLRLLMYFDTARSKWLSVEVAKVAFSDIGVPAGAFFNIGDVNMGGDHGLPFSRAGTVVGIGCSKTAGGTTVVEITRGPMPTPTVIATLDTTPSINEEDETINGDFPAGSVLSVRASVAAITAPIGWFDVRWRA